MLDALERSDVANQILGEGLMEALLAVHRHEVEIGEGGLGRGARGTVPIRLVGLGRRRERWNKTRSCA